MSYILIYLKQYAAVKGQVYQISQEDNFSQKGIIYSIVILSVIDAFHLKWL